MSGKDEESYDRIAKLLRDQATERRLDKLDRTKDHDDTERLDREAIEKLRWKDKS